MSHAFEDRCRARRPVCQCVGPEVGRLMLANRPLALFQVQTLGGVYSDELLMFNTPDDRQAHAGRELSRAIARLSHECVNRQAMGPLW